jgi:DNA-binding transcriptional regulator YdaS (Cro superfamily)
MMDKLKKYIDDNYRARYEFAQLIGVTEAYLSQMLSRKRKPSSMLARRIEIATKEEIQLKDLIEL